MAEKRFSKEYCIVCPDVAVGEEIDTKDKKYVQGTSKRLFPGCENVGWKNCVLLPAVGKQNATFSPKLTQPGKRSLEVLCIHSTINITAAAIALIWWGFWRDVGNEQGRVWILARHTPTIISLLVVIAFPSKKSSNASQQPSVRFLDKADFRERRIEVWGAVQPQKTKGDGEERI